jgi:SPP1 gp7 family putative phage head morphogenesis protein
MFEKMRAAGGFAKEKPAQVAEAEKMLRAFAAMEKGVGERFSWYSAGMNADGGARKIANANLDAWKRSGVVKTLKFYSADDGDACPACKEQDGKVIAMGDGEIGLNLPPLDACTNARCRCYFRPHAHRFTGTEPCAGERLEREGSVPAQRVSSPGLKPPMAAAPHRGPRGKQQWRDE